MKVTYDESTDTLTMILKEGVAVAESDEDRPGVVLDYDAAGDLVSLEILDASRRVTDARRIDYESWRGGRHRRLAARERLDRDAVRADLHEGGPPGLRRVHEAWLDHGRASTRR